ncbi:hypothetical protein [Pseudochrobactrum kiredjianiae]|uniref:Uncharacterized protein n=1 Tax=Pseudochrobactrum kiredjianiae TaxID=386305 RepID=A0ABW3V241_9HYPH|nr:hypothetical protein [Pseudochrobactrum kiredjianiae]MDM7852650.1 hypothetical protein [Pseudochrobactrum kiredjianiae]
MPTFEFRIINPNSGRKIKRIIKAFDEEQLVELLAKDGLVPLDVETIPDEPASEAQLGLMRAKMLHIPAGVTKDEASSLLDNFFERRSVAEPKDFEVARKMRVDVNQYTNKKRLFYSIFIDLTQQGDMQRLGAWYAYRVYRSGCDRDQSDAVSDPLDMRFSAIGALIAADAKLVASLKRAITSSSVHFRWFGIFEAPDGTSLQGDGTHSEIYKFVANQLGSNGLFKLQTKPISNKLNSGRSVEQSTYQQSGWQADASTTKKKFGFWSAVELIAILLGLYWVAKWLFS